MIPCTLVQWLALWFYDSQIAGSNPVGDGQGYELFGEIAFRNRRFSSWIMVVNC